MDFTLMKINFDYHWKELRYAKTRSNISRAQMKYFRFGLPSKKCISFVVLPETLSLDEEDSRSDRIFALTTAATCRYDILIFCSVFSSFLSSSSVRMRCVRAILFFSIFERQRTIGDGLASQEKSATHLDHACARVPVKTCTSFSSDFVASIWKYAFRSSARLKDRKK